jgi:hypothetical protein
VGPARQITPGTPVRVTGAPRQPSPETLARTASPS